MIQRRDFDGERDLGPMQDLVAERTARMGIGTNLHPGDIAHRIWNGNRMHDKVDVVPTWVEGSRIVAFAVVWPKEQALDLVVDPDLDAAARGQVLDEAIDVARDDDRVEADVMGEDEDLLGMLAERGFHLVEGEGFVLTGQSIDLPVEFDRGPYRLRTVTEDDAGRLAEVHASAFGSTWTPESYRTHMEENLGYSPDWELVAEAPDGTFAGFAEMWLDARNGVGYFEPVGVHQDHHRRGVGRMLIRDGMRRMGEAGMTTATVLHEVDDERSTAFYAACGFEPLYPVTRWEKRFPEG